MDQAKSPNQIVETLHTPSPSEHVGPSLTVMPVPQITTPIAPTTSRSSGDSARHIGLRRLLAMNIVFQVGDTPNTPAAENGQGARTDWEKMRLEEIPVKSYFFASIFTWIMLAGFLVLSSSFSSLEEIKTDSGELKEVLQVIRNIPLLTVAYCCCAFGAIGMCCLWWLQSHNYIWLISNIFYPVALNGLSGVISALVNIYTTPSTATGISGIITLTVAGTCTVICCILSSFYWFRMLRPVKDKHAEEKEK